MREHHSDPSAWSRYRMHRSPSCRAPRISLTRSHLMRSKTTATRKLSRTNSAEYKAAWRNIILVNTHTSPGGVLQYPVTILLVGLPQHRLIVQIRICSRTSTLWVTHAHTREKKDAACNRTRRNVVCDYFPQFGGFLPRVALQYVPVANSSEHSAGEEEMQ